MDCRIPFCWDDWVGWSTQLHSYLLAVPGQPQELERMLHRVEEGHYRRASKQPELWENLCEPNTKSAGISSLKAGQTYRQFYERIDEAASELGFRARLKGLRERLNDNSGARVPLVNKGATESPEYRVLVAEADVIHREFDFLCGVLYVWLREIGYSHDDLE